MKQYDYILVGGGAASHAACNSIRSIDSHGSIGWVGKEKHPPYQRPPLTKGLWAGDDPESIWYELTTNRVDLHLGQGVTSIDRRRKRIKLSSGDEYSFGRLLLATGGTPRRLANSSDAVIYFRTVEDYRRLRTSLSRNLRYAVVGGGFIGTEVAAALSRQGMSVTLILPEETIGERVFPSNLSSFLLDYYREHGIEVVTNTWIESIVEERGRLKLRTTSGSALEFDAVVAGLGLQPNVTLAEEAGLAVSDGIVVNQFLQTSDENIFAAGDVANIPLPVLGRRRLEHEDAAMSTGTIAGRNMAGDTRAYDHLPFFYSDLFDLGYEAVGDLDARHEMIADWKTPFTEGVVYYLSGAQIRGVLLWNTWGRVDDARNLILQQNTVDKEALAQGRAGLRPAVPASS